MTAQDGIARPDPDRGKKRGTKPGEDLAPATRVTLDRTDSPPTTDERPLTFRFGEEAHAWITRNAAVLAG